MRYGLIGEKLGHSYSKIIHEAFGLYDYDLIPLTEKEFHTFMKEKEFRGINVTIPYKCDVIPYLDELDSKAKAIGAVNTIVQKNGKLKGYNTDYYGFLDTLTRNQIEVKEKSVLVLGNGGASKAVLAVLKDQEAATITIANRTKKEGTISLEQCYHHAPSYDVIINTTPVGMYPNITEQPIDLVAFTSCQAVIDLIYNPSETNLLKQAAFLSMKAVNGLTMLVSQAKYAAELFTDTKLEETIIDTVMKQF